MKWKGLPVAIFGTGDVSRELIYLIEEINSACRQPVYQVQGLIAEGEQEDSDLDGYPVLSESKFWEWAEGFAILGVAIPMGSPAVKRKIYEKIKGIPKLVYPNFVHPSVNLRNARLGMGNVIQEKVSISVGVLLGDFNLLNYGAFLGHDAEIANFTVINPEARLCGRVKVGGEVLIGVGATVLQNLKIGEKSVVGAGAVVLGDVPEQQTVVGVPATAKGARE